VQAGVDGTIIPDYPPDEAGEWINACWQNDLDTIFLTTPNSTPDRLMAVAENSTGYIYYVSVTGTTGARTQMPAHLKQGIERVRCMTPLPVLVGFGISTPEQAAQVAKVSDGVIVGSALVKTMAGKESNQQALKKLSRLAAAMVKVVKK
jgi:tryptophan synthase alpha chain